MGDILYDMIIQPIWLLLEFVFKTAYSVCNDPGISIIFVSLIVNILVLPLYLRSDAIQEEERVKQKSMESWIRHIRKTFKGDERFMMLSEYYRQNDYQPYYVLRSSLSLLLQIPFFIAAYKFLSELSVLHGASFCGIADLGLPDAMVHVGSVSINVLPVLMTLVNLASSFIYTKNGTMREKVQTAATALIFMVLLYNSPAGLVFYWTLNNVFSLAKNIIMKAIPVSDKSARGENHIGGDGFLGIWLASSSFMTILVGALIPLSILTASPLEFIKRGKYADPTRYVYTSTATAFGLFIVWGGVLFFLANPRIKKIMSRICLVAALSFLVDYMIFDRNFGILFEDLKFSETFSYASHEKILNIFFILNIAFALTVLLKKRTKALTTAMIVLCVSAALLAIYQTADTSVRVRKSDKYVAALDTPTEFSPVLKLSRTGKNVVFLVLDKAIGGYLPYIMQDLPELAGSFSGFTYYPNTVSFAGCTSQGIPAMYAGYEYSAWNINQRSDESLKDKMNEALRLMPELFSQNGYHSTICDVPYGNFTDDGDLSIFDDIDNCDAVSIENGMYSGMLDEEEQKATDPTRQEHNFFCYSLCRVMPLALQHIFYDEGRYSSLSRARVTNEFVNHYVVLKHLSELTDITDGSDELVVLHNDMTHEGALLDPPDYLLRSYSVTDTSVDMSKEIDGRVMHLGNDDQIRDYTTNVSAYMFVAKWLDYLKEEGLYDNTRIIITADHGYGDRQFDDLIHDDIDLDAESINPLLLVKDFGSSGELTVDDSFMSNADAPILAMKDIINDPVNPATGNPVDDSRKYEGPLIVNASRKGITANHEKNTFNLPDSRWYTIHDNIFDAADWAVYE